MTKTELKNEIKRLILHFLVRFPDDTSEIDTIVDEVLSDIELELLRRKEEIVH